MRPGVYSWPDTFLIAYFEGTMDLRISLVAVHLRALWALYPAVKHQAFKQDPAFIQIWRLFEEIRYMLWIRRWSEGAVICKICIKAKTLYKLASHKVCIYLSSLCSISVYVNVLLSIYLKLILRYLIQWSHSYHICFLLATGCKEQ